MAYTPVFSQGVKFIKIARIDGQGNDNTLSLQELDSIRIKFSDVGIVEYPITSISKYDDYFLFGVETTNITSSADNQILNYRFSASYSRNFASGMSYTLDNYGDYGAEAYDNLNYFDLNTGRYTLGNQSNIPIRIVISASVTSSSDEVTTILYINSNLNGVVASDSHYFPTGNPRTIMSASYTITPQINEYFYLSISPGANTNFTGSFFVTQSTTPQTGVSDLVVLQPFIDADFATSEYNVLEGNAIEARINPFYMDVDYSTNALRAVNIEQILSGSATRATVQQSNYTYASHIGGRYVGQQLNGIDINTYTPATEFTGSTPGSVATGSFILSNALGADDFININYGTSEAYYFIAQDDISDNPPNYFFSESVDVPTSLFSASAKINEVLSGSNALEANILKSSFISSTLIFSASFIGDIYNSITIYTGSDFINGPPEFRFMTALNGGSDLINNDSIYGYSGFWPGDISYGKDPVINLYDSCIYEFTTAQDGYPVVENGGTISLGNIYLVGETVDNVTTIDYVSPAYQSIIERNLPIGATVYQQQYINANKLPITLQVTLNGVGVAPSSYFIPSTYVSEYTDGGPQYNVPGIIWFYGSGSTGDPTFNTPFVDFQFSGGGANPKDLGSPITTINDDGTQQTGSLTYGNIMGPIISSSINEGNRWFISFYDNLGNIADGTGLNQFGSPVEIEKVTEIPAIGNPNPVSGHYNLILKTNSNSLVKQLQFLSPGGIGSIGGKGTAYVTGSGYGALIWKAEVESNLITNVGSTSDLYNDVTAGYILLDPTKPIIKNNINVITKRYGKNVGSA
jgi:hypothetical protein